MKSLVLLFFCLQAPAAPQPWKGTLAEGLHEVERLANAGKKDEALALSEQLLALGRRAPVEYARGVVHAAAQEREPSAESFQHARSDGAGELRLASIYNLGSLMLAQGEEWYQKLPEVSGKQAAPAPAPPPGQPPGPDPLAEARKSYLAARGHFVERLRAQWDDADTRANAELVQRRLKRLDEIEKQRKEEQQKQKQQQQSKDSKDQKDSKDKQDQKDQDKPKDDPKDKPDQQQPPQDPKEQQPDKPKDPQKPDEQKPEEQQQKPQDADQKQLTKEELTRLLDKLQQLEEQAAKLRAQIHKARRVAVKKDW